MRAEDEEKDGEFGVPGEGISENRRKGRLRDKGQRKSCRGVREGEGGMVRWKEGEPGEGVIGSGPPGATFRRIVERLEGREV